MSQVSLAQKIPPHILHAANSSRLGMLQDIYESRPVSPLYRLIGLFAAITGTLIILFFFISYETRFSWWPLWQSGLVPLVGAAWLIFGVWLTLSPYLSPRLQVFIYSDGIIYARDDAEVIRWNAMERIWKDIRVSKKTSQALSYTIRRSDDTLFQFTYELKAVEMLGQLLEIEMTYRLLPRAIAAYNVGGPVVFDEIVVSPRGIGIRSGRKLLRWHEFERASIDATKISFFKKGKRAAWTTLKVANIPNVTILHGLLEHIQRALALSQTPHILSFNSGLTVSFGKLRLNTQGIDISNGKNILPWSEILGIGIGEHEIMIRRKGRKQEEYIPLPVTTVSNIAELKELLEYVMHGKT